MRKGNRSHPLRRDPELAPTHDRYSAANRTTLVDAMDHDADLPGTPVLRAHYADHLIDELASGVAQLPKALTPTQKERLAIVVRELTRRSR